MLLINVDTLRWDATTSDEVLLTQVTNQMPFVNYSLKTVPLSNYKREH
jgi:hypothetical protein